MSSLNYVLTSYLNYFRRRAAVGSCWSRRFVRLSLIEHVFGSIFKGYHLNTTCRIHKFSNTYDKLMIFYFISGKFQNDISSKSSHHQKTGRDG